MIDATQIPDEVVEAVQSFLSMYYRDGEGNWISKEHARAALAAALAAWPGLRMMVDIDTGDDAALKLPLPKDGA